MQIVTVNHLSIRTARLPVPHVLGLYRWLTVQLPRSVLALGGGCMEGALSDVGNRCHDCGKCAFRTAD